MKKLSLIKIPAKNLVSKRQRKRCKRVQSQQSYTKLYHQQYIDGIARGKRHKRHDTTPYYRFKESLLVAPGARFGELINFWRSQYERMRERAWVHSHKAVLTIPTVFSLSDEQYASDSFKFIRQLFDCLYHERVVDLLIDYQKCQRIDIDAQVYMDVLLREFIQYYKSCDRLRIKRHVQTIVPINYKEDQIAKVLFSVGGMRLFSKLDIHFSDVIPLPLQIGNRKNRRSTESRDLEITRIVDYVVASLRDVGRELTENAETQLYKVVGEALINASEHATTNYRYAVGYFQKQVQDADVLGTLQLVIMNFGDTIYQKFKDLRCPNKVAVRQMEHLSETYTRRSLFKAAKFEEETLWTLYALQEGVTSHKEWRRGNGSIRFIQSFFGLKGDMACDSESKMTILSGSARIIFDGTYQIVNQEVERNGKPVKHKIMPFNSTNSLHDSPDNKFVKFVADHFPGTMLSARICIKPENTAPID